MDGVSHFVEQGCDFTVSEQGWFFLGWFGEVTYDGDDGALYCAVKETLVAVAGFPCALIFSGARVEIAVERADEAVVICVEDLEHFYVLVPCRVFIGFDEFQTEKFAEMVEAAIQNLCQLVVGTEIFRG